MSRSPKGVTLPQAAPAGLVLVRDCQLACRIIHGCNCLDTCQRILQDYGIEAQVHYAPDGSGALLYLPPDDVAAARRWTELLFPFTCLEEPTLPN